MITSNYSISIRLPHGIRLVDLKHGNNLPPKDHSFCIALGNFDGVHSAHRMLLSAAVRTASARNQCHSAVFCFDPPSSDYLGTSTMSGRHLSTLDEKLSAFAECGIEYAFLADFLSLRDMEPQTFISSVLQQVCHACSVVCGFNFRFGNKGAGTPMLLESILGEENCQTVAPCCVPIGNNASLTVISSSAIRASLFDGRVEISRRLIGQPYSFSSAVISGKQLGRTIGVPTINQAFPDDKILPRSGIYITRCLVGNSWVPGVSNVGSHPTVDVNAPVNCETHLLNFHQNIYGQSVTVEFLCRLRDEKCFTSIEELKEAIQMDIKKAIAYFEI